MSVGRLRKLPQWLLSIAKGERSPFVPDVIYPDDTFLVSFPKSGNTWAKFMLAHLLAPPELEVDFNTAMQVIPEVNRDLEALKQLDRPRIMKSHAPFQPEYPNVIYLVRDGRDAYVSYYHYRRKRLPDGFGLDGYLEQGHHWPCSWSTHVSSWLDAGLDPDRFLLVYYESLHLDAEKELHRMASFVGLQVSEEQIRRAAEQSSFGLMKELEEKRGHPRSSAFSGPFVRQGRTGSWRDSFGPEAKRVFKATENETLLRLGYETDPDW